MMLTSVLAAMMLPAQGSLPLRVQGLDIRNSLGKVVKLRGINICGLEWTAKGEHTLESVDVAFRDWKANVIRVPLSQDRWFGKAPDQTGDPAEYRKLVDDVVAKTARYKGYVLFDLHWSNCAQWGQNIGQHVMPDELSLAFWKDFAARYKNRPEVLFDLYNEPIETTWAIWRDGGEITETVAGKKLTYKAVGLQTLLEAIRAVGAKNLIVAGGLGYAARLDGIPQYALKDPNGDGVVYANHFYPGWESVDSWAGRMAGLQKKMPLLISEFGASPAYQPMNDAKWPLSRVLDVLKKHDLNWVAWCMHPSAQPNMIEDWTYKPTSFFGALVKDALNGKTVPIAARRTTAPDIVAYDDELRIGYQNWGNAKVDFSNAEQTHGGSKSMKVEMAGHQTVMLGNVPFDANPYQALSFWVNGGEKGIEKLKIEARIYDTSKPEVEVGPFPAGKWTRVLLTMPQLGVEGIEGVKSVLIQNPTDAPLPAFYIDDVVWIGKK